MGPRYSRSFAIGSRSRGTGATSESPSASPHAVERLARAQPLRRLFGARARLLLRAQRRGAHEHLLHEQPLGVREVVAVLLVERAHFAVARLDAVRLGHHELDHGRDDVAAHAAVAAREAELEAALDEQLLVEHPIEHVSALFGPDRVAAVGGERRDGAVVLLEPDHRAVHGSRRVRGQRAIALAREQQSQRRAADPAAAPSASQSTARGDAVHCAELARRCTHPRASRHRARPSAQRASGAAPACAHREST